MQGEIVYESQSLPTKSGISIRMGQQHYQYATPDSLAYVWPLKKLTIYTIPKIFRLHLLKAYKTVTYLFISYLFPNICTG